MATKKKVSTRRASLPIPDAMKGLPERLKRTMKEREHITQQGLEEVSGVAQSAISSLLTGITLENVTLATVARLAIGLEVDLDFLVLGKGDQVPRLVVEAKAGAVAVLDEEKSPPLVPSPRKQPKPRKRFPRRA